MFLPSFASGTIMPTVFRSLGGPAFSFFFASFDLSSSVLTCCFSICFMPSFFFPPIFSLAETFYSQHLDWLAYFNLMFLFPFFDWNAKFLLYFSAVDGVHCAERYYASIRNSVMYNTALNAFKVKVVGVHEMH